MRDYQKYAVSLLVIGLIVVIINFIISNDVIASFTIALACFSIMFLMGFMLFGVACSSTKDAHENPSLSETIEEEMTIRNKCVLISSIFVGIFVILNFVLSQDIQWYDVILFSILIFIIIFAACFIFFLQKKVKS